MSSRTGVISAMTTWGFIGSGNIGGTVARLAVTAGHDVVLSDSRGPQTLADLVSQLGPHARAATTREAAKAGDVVVVTIPLRAHQSVPADPLHGKVVIDTMNYYPQRDGQVAELDDESTTTSELLQAHLPDSRVVKALPTPPTGVRALARPVSRGWPHSPRRRAATATCSPRGWRGEQASPCAGQGCQRWFKATSTEVASVARSRRSVPSKCWSATVLRSRPS